MTKNDEREVQYLARYHSIKLSDATIYRILKRNGLNRLPRGTPCAKSIQNAMTNRSRTIISRWALSF